MPRECLVIYELINNDLGYQCMAEHVAHALIVSLFVKRVRPAHN